MKKTILTLIVCIITLTAFSQNKGKRERFKALKIAYITERLELNETEAQKFWPIYNAYEKEKDMLRHTEKEKRRNIKLESLTETEAKTALKDFIAFEKEQHNLKADLFESLLTAIPAKKIILLKIAEEQFKRQMLEEFQKRKEKHKKNTP
ncbi:hypothetical protein [Psychroserpens damuponensis]|uniref:hypothetical protein n=1 Tax=Psychroserpens damuponensis TaxID=943936 RepID=UPI0005902EC4|nr:hypothetical protein [Psychroserpens damuponensis]